MTNQHDEEEDLAAILQAALEEEEPTPAHKLVRLADPDTSHMAAQQLPVTRLEGVVLDTIVGFKHKGCISDEVRRGGLVFGLSYSSVTGRYKALEEKGLIRMDSRKRPGESGRKQRIMWATRYYAPQST